VSSHSLCLASGHVHGSVQFLSNQELEDGINQATTWQVASPCDPKGAPPQAKSFIKRQDAERRALGVLTLESDLERVRPAVAAV